MPKIRRFALLGLALAAAMALLLGVGSLRASSTWADDPVVTPKVTVTQEGSVSVVSVSIQNPKQKNVGIVDIRATIPPGMALVEKDAYAAVDGGGLHWVTKLGYSSSKSGFFYKLDPRGTAGTARVSLTYSGEVSGASSAAVGVPGGTVAVTKAPVGTIDIVPVPANAANPGAIVETLASTGAKVAMGTTGLRVVPVGVPVTLKGGSAADTGPATGFAWTLTGPSASKAKLNVSDQPTVKFTPDVPGYYKVDLVAKNELGTSPMASIQIRADTYIGVGPGGCQTCHPTLTGEWSKTNHAVIMKREIDGGADPATSHYNEGCLRCHTTGYYIGAANGGFADVQQKTGWQFPALESIQRGTGNWAAVPAELKNMANIQCETCHGPAQNHVASGAAMDKSLDEGVCNVCHNGGGHHVKGAMFANAKHGDATSQAWTYPVGPARQDCVRCHSGAGFISFLKNPTEKASWDNSMQTVTCAVCHDPHSEANPRQLRISGEPVQVAGVTKDFAQSTVCVECHNARTTAADAAKGQFPHYSSAAEMMSNTGGVDYGKTVADSPHGMIVGTSPVRDPNPNAETPFLFGGQTPGNCVACHMWPTPEDAKDPNRFKVGDHSFNMVSPDGKFEYTEACQSCHSGIEEFNFKAKADYDGDGNVEGVQDEVAGLLNVLQKAIGDSGVKPVKGHPYFDRADVAKANDKQKNAIYNYLFVRGLEGSDGKGAAIHNFKRSVSLLQLSYKDLTGKDVPNATLLAQ